jgi:hypothetical protein
MFILFHGKEFPHIHISCNIFKILERKDCDRLRTWLWKTKNAYRILVNAAWSAEIFKTGNVGTWILVKKFQEWDTAREETIHRTESIFFKLERKEGLQCMGWLQMAHDTGDLDTWMFCSNNQFKSHTFNFLTRWITVNLHQAVCAPAVHWITVLPKILLPRWQSLE